MKQEALQPRGLFRVAAATPPVRVADAAYNAEAMRKAIEEAASKGAAVILFPALSMTGCTSGDLFWSSTLLESAAEQLWRLIEATRELPILCAAGLPVASDGALYSCTALFSRGRLLALPAQQAPSALRRWFSPAPEDGAVRFCGKSYPSAGVRIALSPEVLVGVEFFEDAAALCPPGTALAQSGVTVLLHPAAAFETVNGAACRRDLLRVHAKRLHTACVFANCGLGESTTDYVFAGGNLVVEDGRVLGEGAPFESGIVYGDVDAERLLFERRRSGMAQKAGGAEPISAGFQLPAFEAARVESPYPFVPEDGAVRAARCDAILEMQAAGLATRLMHIGCRTVVLGVSGGLDSTLAMLVAARAFDRLGLDRRGIHAVSMPCFGTTNRTKSNAQRLSEALDADFREIPIALSVTQHFKDIGHDGETLDVTFENAQARERTQVLMDIANRENGLVVGTGDLSELALGWATYNGDHMSMYAVNASVPKTLMRHLVARAAAVSGSAALGAVLLDVLDTPVSPELLPPKDGEIAQCTEALVGPYDLHDYFLYYTLRCGFSPRKIYAMAKRSFAGVFEADEIKKWLQVFCRRFFTQQFKRSCMPDGPKIGSVGLSPRGDLCMPSDASNSAWLAEANTL